MVKRDIFDIPSVSSQPVTILPPRTINTKCRNICTRSTEKSTYSHSFIHELLLDPFLVTDIRVSDLLDYTRKDSYSYPGF